MIFTTSILPIPCLAETLPAKNDKDVTNEIKKDMSVDQQVAIFNYAKIGLNWVSGSTSIQDVIKTLGEPDYHSDRPGKTEYSWFPGNTMEINFVFERDEKTGNTRIGYFNLTVDDSLTTNIPYTKFDDLGLHRIVRGEKIDNIRTEAGDFYEPIGVIAASGSIPINQTGFAYRLALPSDSTYDIYLGLTYLAELKSDKGPWDLSNVRNASNLRALGIYRHYLTPDELNKRNESKREKYGYMNLCTGAICPETGIWEGWTKDGPTDVLRVEKGRKFDVVRTVSINQSTAPCPMIEGQWMWLCALQDERGFVWNGMALGG